MTGVLRRVEAVAVILGSFVLAALVIRHKHALEGLLETIGPFSYPLAIALFTIVASAPFSVTDALAIMNGVLFGPVGGSLVNGVGIICAAIVGYLIAKRTCKLLDLDASLSRLPGWVRHFRIGSPQFLLTVRVIPGLGGTIATQVAAAFKVPMFTHVWTMSAIAIPICTLLAIFGDRVSAAAHAYYEAHRPHMHMHMPHIPRMHVPDMHLRFHTPLPEHR